MPTARTFHVEATFGLELTVHKSVLVFSLYLSNTGHSHGESQFILSSLRYMAGRKRWDLLDEICSVVLLVL